MKSAVIDGGITPYQLPWVVTRFIAVRDFLMIYMGKLGGIKLLEKAFSTDEYSDEFFEGAGFVKIRTKLIDGRVPCAVAVISKPGKG